MPPRICPEKSAADKQTGCRTVSAARLVISGLWVILSICLVLTNWARDNFANALVAAPDRAETRAAVPDLHPDTKDFAAWPVLHEGRLKPMDSFARAIVTTLSGKETVHYPEGEEKRAVDVMATILFRPDIAATYPIFYVPNQEVMVALGVHDVDGQKRWSFAELFLPVRRSLGLIEELVRREQSGQNLTRAQQGVLELYQKTLLYLELSKSLSIFTPDFNLSETDNSDKLGLPHGMPFSYVEMMQVKDRYLELVAPLLKGEPEKRRDWSAQELDLLALGDVMRRKDQEKEAAILRIIPHEGMGQNGVWIAPWRVWEEGGGTPANAALFDILDRMVKNSAAGDWAAWARLAAEYRDGVNAIALRIARTRDVGSGNIGAGNVAGKARAGDEGAGRVGEGSAGDGSVGDGRVSGNTGDGRVDADSVNPGNASADGTDAGRMHAVGESAGQTYAYGRIFGYELFYNRADLFHWSLGLYIAAFVLGIAGLIFMQPGLWRAGFWALCAGLVPHVAGIALRMVIMGRPPVATLYESIVFVALVAVIFALILERRLRNGQSLVMGALLGAALQFVGLRFAMNGDTMGMLVAVLNTNFWLSTHVVTITIGYGTSLICGAAAHWAAIGMAVRRMRGQADVRADAHAQRVITASALVALFFTTFGTILGGIWADQSWGRFWGWDPKENGALLIVLWLIFMLHGRIGGVLRDRAYILCGMATCPIVAVAWFGVNFLSVGLHSYGFSDRLAEALGGFLAFEAVVIAGLWILLMRRVAGMNNEGSGA